MGVEHLSSEQSKTLDAAFITGDVATIKKQLTALEKGHPLALEVLVDATFNVGA